MRAAYPAHFLFLDLNTLIVFDEGYRRGRSSLCNIIKPPDTSCFSPRYKCSPQHINLEHLFFFFTRMTDAMLHGTLWTRHACPRAANEGDCLQIRRVVANTSNKQARTADKGLGEGIQFLAVKKHLVKKWVDSCINTVINLRVPQKARIFY
jgi:hypothetical protein